MLPTMFCSSIAKSKNVGIAYCFNKGMGWLSWVSLTSLLANGSPDSSCTMSEKGITTRLFSSILFNEFYLFRRYFNVYFSADIQKFIVLGVKYFLSKRSGTASTVLLFVTKDSEYG